MAQARAVKAPGRTAAPAFPAPSPQALALRAAGLSVTSARLATLRVASAVLQAQGHLHPQPVFDAIRLQGYAVSQSALYRVLQDLAMAGLLPAAALHPSLMASLHVRDRRGAHVSHAKELD
jgi:Fe2+ or Zn2+ uptake regulation protein